MDKIFILAAFIPFFIGVILAMNFLPGLTKTSDWDPILVGSCFFLAALFSSLCLIIRENCGVPSWLLLSILVISVPSGIRLYWIHYKEKRELMKGKSY